MADVRQRRTSRLDRRVALDSDVSLEGVALIPRCVECGAVRLPAGEERWRAYLGGDDLDEPAELFFYCPECAEREFKS
jgi:hypothetical protein